MTTLSVEAIKQKFLGRKATIGVVGLGYVGLPTVFAFHDAGFTVIGFDIDEEKIVNLKAGKAYLHHLGSEKVVELSRSSRFKATSRPEDLKPCDAVIICVPTPLGHHREPDLTYVEKSTEMVAKTLHAGELVILTSTSYPGTTREISLPILEKTGLKNGRADGFFLAFSPEREDPGRQGFTTKTIPRLVGGCDPDAGMLAHTLLSQAVTDVKLCENADTAEAAKILENTYRCVNIALVNELKPVLDTMGIDIWKVIEAASTKPFGFQAFYPGPGLGGHCIPIDPYYLTWKAREVGHSTRFIELAGEVNNSMPHYVIEQTAKALNEHGKAMKGADILIIGLAYKPNIDDTRETPAAEVITLLGKRGAKVSYHDPHVAKFPRMRHYNHDMESQALTPDRLKQADAVLIITDHKAVDWTIIGQHAKLVVDTRNAMAKSTLPVKAQVVKA